MKLRAFEVAHWGCIGSLRLKDLPDGVIVLHGPNGIGKSSLVQALRSCLFDHDHNSQNAIVQGAVHWRSQAIPQVGVEFETKGRRCRITKAFSKLKDGSAHLEEHTGFGWTTLARGKEANPKTRELLGVNKSEAGLFQLLWLHQGDVQLPEKVDGQLQQAVEAILGTMITGRDIEFKARLDKACGIWFTPLMGNKKDSPLNRWTADLEAAKQSLATIQQQLREMDDALRQHEIARLQLPQSLHEVEAAEQELTALNQAAAAARERQYAHELARRDLERTHQSLVEAQQRLTALRNITASATACRSLLDDLIAQRESARQRRGLLQTAVEHARNAHQAAQATLTQWQHAQLDLNDREQLVALAQQQQALDKTTDALRQFGVRQKELEKLLAGPPALLEKELEDLRANRQDAQRLQAQIEAEAIRLSFHAEHDLTLRAAVDGQSPQTTTMAADEVSQWTIRQHGTLTLPGFGVVTVGRGADHQGLEEAARRLLRLNETFAAALTRAQVDSWHPKALDELAERRIHQATWSRELHSIREQIRQLAPQGVDALPGNRTQIELHRRQLLDRHPDWETWAPSAEALQFLRAEHSRRHAALQQAVDLAASDLRQVEQEAAVSDKAVHGLDVRVAETEASWRSLLGQLQQAGSEDSIQQIVAAAAAEQAVAQQRVTATALTEEERNMDGRVQAAAEALRRRQERLHDNEKTLANQLGKLAGTEGLHQQHIQAEQLVNDLTASLAREQLQADAHRHVRELFERVRQSQVQRTVGPVSDRVIAWAQRLGIDDYRGLDFGDSVLPSRLQRSVASADAESVDMQTESYGRMEQLSLLIRLALGGLLAKDEPAVAIFDDPLAHADPNKHRRFLEVLRLAAAGNREAHPPAGELQIIVLTCHPDRFDHLPEALHVDLTKCITPARTASPMM